MVSGWSMGEREGGHGNGSIYMDGNECMIVRTA
jgi:hypothetical protein